MLKLSSYESEWEKANTKQIHALAKDLASRESVAKLSERLSKYPFAILETHAATLAYDNKRNCLMNAVRYAKQKSK